MEGCCCLSLRLWSWSFRLRMVCSISPSLIAVRSLLIAAAPPLQRSLSLWKLSALLPGLHLPACFLFLSELYLLTDTFYHTNLSLHLHRDTSMRTGCSHTCVYTISCTPPYGQKYVSRDLMKERLMIKVFQLCVCSLILFQHDTKSGCPHTLRFPSSSPEVPLRFS